MLTRKWNWTKTNETETGRSCLSGWQRLNGRCEGQQEETQTALLYAGCSLCLSECCVVLVANFSCHATKTSICKWRGGGVSSRLSSRSSVSYSTTPCRTSIAHIFLRGLSHWTLLRWDGDTISLRYDSRLCFKWDFARWVDVITICSRRSDTIQLLLSTLCRLSFSLKHIATDVRSMPHTVHHGLRSVVLGYVRMSEEEI